MASARGPKATKQPTGTAKQPGANAYGGTAGTATVAGSAGTAGIQKKQPTGIPAGTPKQPKSSQPAPPPLTPVGPNSAVGFDGGSGSGYAGGQIDSNATGQYGTVQGTVEPTPAPKSIYDMGADEQNSLIAPDQDYSSELAAYLSALNSLNAGLDLESTDMGNAYKKNLTDLGWRDNGDGVVDANDWDRYNLGTAYGSSYANTENDFSGRGMLDSSAFLEALQRLQTDFNDQKTGLDTSNASQTADIALRRGTGKSTYESNLASARSQALARYAQANGMI